MARRIPHVALLIETARSYGRDLLQGVGHYIAERGPWSVFLERRALESRPPPWLRTWRGDGILTRTGSQAMADMIRRLGVPTVELRATKLRHSFPGVGADNHAAGRMVAEHLLERGFRRFGVYKIGTEVYFEQRHEAFVEALRERGCPCEVYHVPGQGETPAHWETHENRLAQWVKRLPKPVGIMACTDQLGFWLLDACRRAGVAVPEEVAVVGVEDDESLCTMASPPLSSVRLGADRIGYRAAALLDRLMAGKPPTKQTIVLQPVGIVTRPSSDIVALEDGLVARALRLIRDKACDGLTVEDLLDSLVVSRSSLERRMRQAIGRSPKAQIMRVRLDRARRLLTDTGLSVAAVAEQTGFKQPHHLSTVYKACYGHFPSAERRGAAQ